MNKLILIVLFFLTALSLTAMDRLKSISQLKGYPLVFLVYEKSGCPWCIRYKNELDYIEIKYKSSIKFFKVKKGSKAASILRKEFGYKPIIYPMTYILKKEKSKLLYEIYGYQTQEYIEEVFRDEVFKK